MSLLASIVLATQVAAPVASPATSSDRDDFLTNVYRSGEWLPPRTGSLEAWRVWLFAEPQEVSPGPRPPAPDVVPANQATA